LSVHGQRVSLGERWSSHAPAGPSTGSACGRVRCPRRAHAPARFGGLSPRSCNTGGKWSGKPHIVGIPGGRRWACPQYQQRQNVPSQQGHGGAACMHPPGVARSCCGVSVVLFRGLNQVANRWLAPVAAPLSRWVLTVGKRGGGVASLRPPAACITSVSTP
jgi:hypothetical protein